MKTLLHVGCGAMHKTDLKGFDSGEWQEIRLDINKSVNPDIIGTLTNMERVPDASIDAIYSAHNIEHLYPHEVPLALKEFYRVLKTDGFVVITCPDLQSVCEVIANNKLLEPLYESSSGPISPIDILYGHRESLAHGNLYMAHKGGFTYTTLYYSFLNEGFHQCYGGRRKESYDLWLAAFKSYLPENEIKEIAKCYLP